MSYLRVTEYPLRENRFKYVEIKRGRPFVNEKAMKNTDLILEKLEQGEKSDENLSRARRVVRDIIFCNKFDLFCTFTFNKEFIDRYDYNACKKRITEFFKNYKNRYSISFRYLIIPEFHKDGAFHFHGLIRGILPDHLVVPEYIHARNKKTGEMKKIKNTKGYVDWSYYSEKLGFFSCSEIKDYERCAIYVSKYITKDLMKLPLGQRVFFCSKNLNRPELIFDSDGVPFPDRPDYENEFVRVLETNDPYEYIDPWRGDECSETRDPRYMEDVPEEEAEIFQRLTGEQLQVYNWNQVRALG